MGYLHISRACGFSLILYIATFVVFAILSVIFGVSTASAPDDISMLQRVIYWIVLVPLIVVVAKWYFRKFQPSFKRGVVLGMFTLVAFVILDAIILLASMPGGEGWSMLKTMYSEWKFYIAFVITLATTAYAGFEFDRTYTFGDGALHKKS
jgi:hypothetical protein